MHLVSYPAAYARTPPPQCSLRWWGAGIRGGVRDHVHSARGATLQIPSPFQISTGRTASARMQCHLFQILEPGM